MAKTYREIGLTYGIVATVIDVRTDREITERQEFSTSKRAIDGTLYTQYTTINTKRTFTYQFNYCDEDVLSFFKDAYTAGKSGNEVTMDRELDDATTESLIVKVGQPQYSEETVGDDFKLYKNLRVSITEV